jgi:hypothetical protein
MVENAPKIAYQQALAKLDWAKQHLKKFNAATRVFHDTHPFTTFIKENPETGELVYYVGEIPEIPAHISLIAGDVLHSLRSALDYLACGMVPTVTANTKFPIGHSAQHYKSSLGRLVPGLSQKALEVLEEIKPYQGGNLLLWTLHRLDNIDKHRLLLAACMTEFTHSLTPEEIAVQEPLGPKDIPLTIHREVLNLPAGTQMIVKFTNRERLPVALHAGDKILTVANTKANQDVRFIFAIAFNEPGISEGMPANMALDFIACEVNRVIRKLAPFVIR